MADLVITQSCSDATSVQNVPTPNCDVGSPFSSSWALLKVDTPAKGHARSLDGRSSATASTSPGSASPCITEAFEGSPRSGPAKLTRDMFLAERFCDAVHVKQESVQARQMFLRMVRMLRQCNYEDDVIELVLVLALAQLDAIFAVTDTRMGDTERVSIAVMQCFNAHSYVIDEPCPMKYWHIHIFTNYCSLKVLNAVAVKLMCILKYKLSVAEDLQAKKRALLG